MLKQLLFKKNFLLAGGSLLLLLVCYQFAFKRTLDAWQLNRQLTEQLGSGNDLGYQPGYLDRKGRNLDRILELYRSDTTLFRSGTISTIAVLAAKYKVKLTVVPARDAIYQRDHSVIQKLGFEGDFFALNRFLNQLESSTGIGMPVAVDLKTQRKGINPDQQRLMMDVYMVILK